MLLGDLLERTLQKYGSLLVLPVRSPSEVTLGGLMKNRMRYNASAVQASFNPDQKTMTITATSSAVVPVTGLCTAAPEVYGGQCISHVSLGAGQSVNYSL